MNLQLVFGNPKSKKSGSKTMAVKGKGKKKAKKVVRKATKKRVAKKAKKVVAKKRAKKVVAKKRAKKVVAKKKAKKTVAKKRATKKVAKKATKKKTKKRVAKRIKRNPVSKSKKAHRKAMRENMKQREQDKLNWEKQLADTPSEKRKRLKEESRERTAKLRAKNKAEGKVTSVKKAKKKVNKKTTPKKAKAKKANKKASKKTSSIKAKTWNVKSKKDFDRISKKLTDKGDSVVFKTKRGKLSFIKNPIKGVNMKLEKYLKHDINEAGGLFLGSVINQGVNEGLGKMAPQLALGVGKVFGKFSGSVVSLAIGVASAMGADKLKNKQAQNIAKGMIGASVTALGATAYEALRQMMGKTSPVSGFSVGASQNYAPEMNYGTDFSGFITNDGMSGFTYGDDQLNGYGEYNDNADFGYVDNADFGYNEEEYDY